MLILEENNRIIESSLQSLAKKRKLLDILDVTFCDYGETSCHLGSQDDDNIALSISIPGIKELEALGLQGYLQKIYKDCRVAIDDKAIILTIPVDSLNDVLIEKLSKIRIQILSLPFHLASKAQSTQSSTPLMVIPLRNKDFITIKAESDRVTIVLATKFDDPSDVVLGKVFLQELSDQRQQTKFQYAPSVKWCARKPAEIDSIQDVDEELNFITFILFPPHLTPEKQSKSISTIVLFRDYFHYHIKCCKGLLHTRMRSKVDYFLGKLEKSKASKG